MNEKRRINRLILLFLAALMMVAALVTLLYLWRVNDTTPPQESGSADMELAGRKTDIPQHMTLGESLADVTYITPEGQDIQLSELQGDYLVLIYWASWCRYCGEELEQLPALKRVLETEGDVQLLLVDALDGEKETTERAEEYLKEKQIQGQVVYDQDKAVYEELGIAKLPTMLILSPDSRVLATFPGKTTSASSFQSMLHYVKSGYAAPTLDFLTGQMMTADGGVYTTLQETGDTHPAGQDVLSESQGLLMEYAAEAGDRALFDRVYGYAKRHLEKDGLFLWYTSPAADTASNAFLDDLRIYGALLQAQEQWGGYEQELAVLETALCRYNLTAEGPVDFYDFKQRKQSDTFSLCYGDLETIQALEERTGTAGLYEQTKDLVLNGYISDDFPLYYSSWSYRKGDYSEEPLHTAEAMYTLYHLAKVGLLPETTEQWIMEQLRGNGILAGYQVDGSVAAGGGYESTGIYALTALIGMECENEQMTALAVGRMNSLRIFDQASLYDGAFGEPDGSGIYSFDQCMALKAYEQLNQHVSVLNRP